jgi:hypothetical protein
MASSDERIPPILDLPEVDGDLWKEQVDLAHLLPQAGVFEYSIRRIRILRKWKNSIRIRIRRIRIRIAKLEFDSREL